MIRMISWLHICTYIMCILVPDCGYTYVHTCALVPDYKYTYIHMCALVWDCLHAYILYSIGSRFAFSCSVHEPCSVLP